ncbi:uncharacterized protein LOC113049257 [Carassius auratus]|uniref:Uncharacterized protein LOC113049257 n=1 Tax=Carassius auratus TaxID=7957 RepID=A0A6P6K4M8_CARAU|nr:uncharacterized protein LOC113049257 [Carassius auratus]XP_052411877.1 uncharacterized protein LOC127957393 [Carassius gibelio]
MDTARANRAHIIWTSIALGFILIASCLTYVFMSKVSGCRISIVNGSIIESMFSRKYDHPISQEHWLLKARGYNQTNDYLIWEDEWHGYRNKNESVLDHTKMSMIVREKGVYLVYIQVNFQLDPQKITDSTVELKILVYFTSDGEEQLFAAAQDTQVVIDSDLQDAKLNTFLLMKMQPKSQLSVRVFPSEFVNCKPQPFSSFITIIKWADNW